MLESIRRRGNQGLFFTRSGDTIADLRKTDRLWSVVLRESRKSGSRIIADRVHM